MRRTATPGEIAAWTRELAPLPHARQVAAIRMLSEAVAGCPHCDEAVRRCDSRGLVQARLVHLCCAPPGDLTSGQRDALAHRDRQRNSQGRGLPGESGIARRDPA